MTPASAPTTAKTRGMQLKAEREGGFTLAELLVVIVILGVLTVIAIPALGAQRRRAADAQMKSDLRAVAARMETWFADMNSYPSTIDVTAGRATLPGGYVVPLSPGTTVSVTTPARPGSLNTYCLIASRVPGTSAGTQNWVFVNDRNGIQGVGVVSCD